GFGTGGAGVGISSACDVQTDAQIASSVSEKRRKDEVAIAAAIAQGTPAIKLVYEDGDQHKSFKQILASSGTGALHSRASWASRDVGISRSDALTVGPRIVLLDNAGKPRGDAVRAANSDSDTVLSAARQLAEQKPEVASPVPAMTPKPATEKPAAQVAQSPRQPTTGRNVRDQSEVAKAEPKAEEKPAESGGVMQRVMALNPFAR
ncbi:MAG: hypothetical protein ACRCWO_01435, partial [Bosea sp. (in: a-proteobacteria)]